MSDFKQQLIKLGNQNPRLRPHIRRILREQKKAAWSYEPLLKELHQHEEDLFDLDKEIVNDVSRFFDNRLPRGVEKKLRLASKTLAEAQNWLSSLRGEIQSAVTTRSAAGPMTRREYDEYADEQYAAYSEEMSRKWEHLVEQAKKEYVALNRKWGETDARNWQQFLRDSNYMSMPAEDRIYEILSHVNMRGMDRNEEHAFYDWLESNGDQLLYRGFERDIARYQP